MTLITLKNDLLTLTVSTLGAEPQSLRANRTGHEYLWQGDPCFWGRRAPVLFPIVGAVSGGRYRMDGREFAMGQHGFARDMEFTPIDCDADDEIWLELVSSAETCERWPRDFRLQIGYRLVQERVTVMWRVANTSATADMPFQIGFHPGFNYPDFMAADTVHGYMMADRNSGLRREVLTPQGVTEGDEPLTLDADGMLPLDRQTFSRDAIILAGQNVHRLSMLTKDRTPYLTMLFHTPVVGIWSPRPDAPFVCIEPWWGRADRIGYAGDFASREHIVTLAPGRTHTDSFLLIIDNL